ncbi:hypothetical protein Taro_033777 [Colocasia esculenta]|uniref:Uncharacterized protein n=1 Tax=Colocasia esculenta TaxID=4460 RepID=A0A843W7Y2_COLES|nr:hypothetical protein [Colocasia esculenta]
MVSFSSDGGRLLRSAGGPRRTSKILRQTSLMVIFSSEGGKMSSTGTNVGHASLGHSTTANSLRDVRWPRAVSGKDTRPRQSIITNRTSFGRGCRNSPPAKEVRFGQSLISKEDKEVEEEEGNGDGNHPGNSLNPTSPILSFFSVGGRGGSCLSLGQSSITSKEQGMMLSWWCWHCYLTNLAVIPMWHLPLLPFVHKRREDPRLVFHPARRSDSSISLDGQTPDAAGGPQAFEYLLVQSWIHQMISLDWMASSLLFTSSRDRMESCRSMSISASSFIGCIPQSKQSA